MKNKTRTRQAVESMHQARQERYKPYPLAHVYKRETDRLLTPAESPVIYNGEVLPPRDDSSNSAYIIRETLLDPDTPAVDASLQRLDLLDKAAALEVGLDAANSIQAGNSLEKMLAHQMATCHVKAMALIAEEINPYADYAHQELQLRKIALATKLFDVYQKGLETLIRCRTAGKQTITVKQVHISGGQNVIADSVSTGNHGEG